MESEKQVLNDALDQLITEAGHMLQDFKQQIIFENENTLKKSDSDAKHLKAYTSLMAQWSQIKNLYMLILSTQDKESVEKIAPIEVILLKISSPEVKFKNHEFQFPFNVTTMISFVKGIVKASQRPERKATKKLSEDTIDTNNVREAAKKFQELTERVAETVTLSKKKTIKPSQDQKVKILLMQSPLKNRSATVRVSPSRSEGESDKSKSPVDETMNYLYGSETESPKAMPDETKYDRLGRPRPPVPTKPKFEELAAKLRSKSLSRSATTKVPTKSASGPTDSADHSRTSSSVIRADSAPPDFENSLSKEGLPALQSENEESKTKSITAASTDNVSKSNISQSPSFTRLTSFTASQENVNGANSGKSTSSGILKKIETIQYQSQESPKSTRKPEVSNNLSVSDLANMYQSPSPTMSRPELNRSGSMKIKSSVREQIAALQKLGSQNLGSTSNLKVTSESNSHLDEVKKSHDEVAGFSNNVTDLPKTVETAVVIQAVISHSAPVPNTDLLSKKELESAARPLSLQGDRKPSIKTEAFSAPESQIKADLIDPTSPSDEAFVLASSESRKPSIIPDSQAENLPRKLSGEKRPSTASRKGSLGESRRSVKNTDESFPAPVLSRRPSMKPSVEVIEETNKVTESVGIVPIFSKSDKVLPPLPTSRNPSVKRVINPSPLSRETSIKKSESADSRQAKTSDLEETGQSALSENLRKTSSSSTSTIDPQQLKNTKSASNSEGNLEVYDNYVASEIVERSVPPKRTPVSQDEVDNPFRSGSKNRLSIGGDAKNKSSLTRTPIDENEVDNPLRGKSSFRNENSNTGPKSPIIEDIGRVSRSYREAKNALVMQDEKIQDVLVNNRLSFAAKRNSVQSNRKSSVPEPEVNQDINMDDLHAALGESEEAAIGLGYQEFSVATVVKTRRDTINDMTEDEIAELDFEMDHSQGSEPDGDSYIPTTTSNRRISLPMTSVFGTSENDPLLSLQTHSMLNSFHGDSKMDLDAESIGDVSGDEYPSEELKNANAEKQHSGDALLPANAEIIDISGGANQNTPKHKAHRAVHLEQLKTKPNYQESPMNALYAAVHSETALPPPMINRNAKPSSPSKSAPPNNNLQIRDEKGLATSARKGGEIVSMMFTDKDYIMGIMNAFDEQEKLLDESDDADIADEESISSQNPPKSQVKPVVQPSPLPKVKEEYDMRKEIPTIKDDFGLEFNELFNSLNSKYEISNREGPSTKAPPKKPQSETKPKKSRTASSGQDSLNTEIPTELLQAIAEKTDENSSLMTIKPPQKQPAPPPAYKPADQVGGGNRKSLRPSLRVDPRPKSRMGDSGPKYLERPVSRLMKSPTPEESATLSTKNQPFDPAKAERVIAEDEIEDEDRNISINRLHQFNAPFKNYNVLLVPLNAMFDMRAIEMTVSHRFGRNNTTNHPAFKGFGTLVVSRNHVDMFERDGKIFIKDIGSNSGTFRNNARLSPPGQPSPEVELHTGDYIQLGKDFQDDSPLDEFGRIPARRRCVRFQVVIIAPGQNAATAIRSQPIPIEKPVNRSDSMPIQDGSPAPVIPLAKEVSSETKENSEETNNKENSSKESLSNSKKELAATPSSTLGASSPLPNATPLYTVKAGNNVTNEILKGNPGNIKDILKAQANIEHFIISYIVAGGKVTKLQVCGASNVTLMEVNLKKWEERARFTVVDFRMGVGHGFDIFLETKPGAKSPAKLKNFSDNVPWHVVLSDGTHVGQLVYVNGFKLELNPTEKPADGSIVAISGDFKEQRYIVVKKWPNTREQQRFGECKGKHLVKKTFLDTTWNCNFEMQDSKNNRLVLCGAILSCILNP